MGKEEEKNEEDREGEIARGREGERERDHLYVCADARIRSVPVALRTKYVIFFQDYTC